jgi:integrase
MATIKRRNSRWQATVRVEGKERTQTFDKKVDAARWVSSVQHDVMRGTYVDLAAAKVTLADYAADWLERMGPTWRPASLKNATGSINRHVLPVLGDRRLATIRRGDVEALYASLHLAPSSVALVHRHLRQLLGSAVEDGVLVRNPALRARLPRQEDAKAQPVAAAVVAEITDALPAWLQIVVPLGVGVGLRIGEALGLTVDRVDFLRRSLRVDRQLVGRDGTEPIFGPPKTPTSNRTIPLASFVVDALAEHLQQFPAGPGDLILRVPKGGPVDWARFGQQWRPAVDAAGSPGLGYHALRHTFASTLLSRGVSVKAVGDWLGHASPVVTLSTYSHLMPADEDVARAVLDAALAPDADQARTTPVIRVL